MWSDLQRIEAIIVRQILRRLWSQETRVDLIIASATVWLLVTLALSAYTSRVIRTKSWFDVFPEALIATAPAFAVLILIGAVRIKRKKS